MLGSYHLNEWFDFHFGVDDADIMSDDVSCHVSDEAPHEMAAELQTERGSGIP